MSPTEIQRGAPVFETVRWDKRREHNLLKQLRQGGRSDVS